ncbi:hypothetical protein [Burkholderia cenocepacia]|nr:hypothetical protein [Burkholderia cenocepacia]
MSERREPTCARMAVLGVRILLLGALSAPLSASAHFFAQPYTMPVPFQVYALAVGLALGLSFLLIGVFAAVPTLGPSAPEAGCPVPASRLARWASGVGRVLSVALLVLCIATGAVGTKNPFTNFNMSFFWIIFVLVIPYAVALLGNFYSKVNPWLAIVDTLEKVLGVSFAGKLSYPKGLGHYPALLLYIIFIWLELFGALTPRGLSLCLVAYTVTNLCGAWLVGSRDWFRYCEFFGVMMHFFAFLAPLRRARNACFAKEAATAVGFSLSVFVIFMLSSTAFDGVHSTLPFAHLYWVWVLPLMSPLLEALGANTRGLATSLYYVWQWAMLLVMLVFYVLVYTAFIWMARFVARSQHPIQMLMNRFALSLIPVAFVYHVAHYFTLIFSQGAQLVRIVSDPFGWGWNLFGTANVDPAPLMLDTGIIWHLQVSFILIGHVLGVYWAHVDALAVFGTRKAALVSQLPMLFLMLFLTTFGLWILSLPIA